MFKNLDIEKTQAIIDNVKTLVINNSEHTNIKDIQNITDDLMTNLSQAGDYEIGEIYSVFLGTNRDTTEFSIVFKHHHGIETIIMKIKAFSKNKKINELHICSLDEFSPELLRMKYD